MHLSLLSAALGLAAFGFLLRYRRDVLHPAFWTNAGFAGYAVGGLFFQFAGPEAAMFLDLADVEIAERTRWFVIAQWIVVVGFVAANIGFSWGDEAGPFKRIERVDRLIAEPSDTRLWINVALGLSLAASLAGGLYWTYFVGAIAGGIVDLFAQIAVYPYLVADAGISALPMRLFFAGMFLWILVWATTTDRYLPTLVLLPLGVLIVYSSGRIAAANALLLAGLFAVLLIRRGRVTMPFLLGSLAFVVPGAVFFYFFRIYSSYVYIGRVGDFALLNPAPTPATSDLVEAVPPPAVDGAPAPQSGPAAEPVPPQPTPDASAPQAAESPVVPDTAITPSGPETADGSSILDGLWAPLERLWDRVSYIVEALIGGGNIPDLQQIVLIVRGLLDGRLAFEYGATYFDWLVNLLGARIGVFDESIQSVGYRILHAYFPDKFGGPTPGMVGEAILNFGLLFPLAIIAICALTTRFYRTVIVMRSAMPKVFYCLFLLNFWALFIKVDASLALDLMWAAGPFVALWAAAMVLTKTLQVFTTGTGSSSAAPPFAAKAGGPGSVR